MHVLKIVAIVVAVWFVVSIPAALLIARFIKSGKGSCL